MTSMVRGIVWPGLAACLLAGCPVQGPPAPKAAAAGTAATASGPSGPIASAIFGTAPVARRPA